MVNRLSTRSSFGLLMASAATAVTNPDPNTLGVTDPYGIPNPPQFNSVSAAWTGQAVKAIFPKLREQQLEGHLPITWFAFSPSVPGATFDVDIWFYHKESSSWIQPLSGSSASYGPEYADFIEVPLLAPIFFQLSNISAGTVDIYVDGQNTEVL